ncbi:uncharacterized protein LOC118735540 [Rhagoletis pomonella]|uniref:uncharacterized protein LOC118735540 n=1 Tax=Rhagoletis pomonella TaxID=28610 RepID=UPI0017839FA2|nr:uncharacterized protein LOC118735540 [Rhagoletis pomonella]
MFHLHPLFLTFTFVCYPAFFIRNDIKVIALAATDIGYLDAVENSPTTKVDASNTAAAALEMDILMPPIEFTESIAAIADVTAATANGKMSDGDKDDSMRTPNWWHTYDALMVALGMIVMLVLMVFITHCIWRRHIERRALEWEAESARIFSSTPCFIDRSQILVY